MKQAREAMISMTGWNDWSTKAFNDLTKAIEQAEEKNCKNCVIDKPCIAKGKDMQICGAFVSKHAKELKQIALDKKAENAKGLGLDYEPAQAEKQEPVAWMFDWDVYDPTNSGPDFFRTKPDDGKDWKPLYTTPQPQQDAWKNAAIRLGEELSSVGPDGYYNMTAEQWLDWAMDQQPRGKNSLSQPQREWVGLTYGEFSDCLVEGDPCEALAEPEVWAVMREVADKLKEKNT
jgi:hypothetical protein